jgi:hypothetical protein
MLKEKIIFATALVIAWVVGFTAVYLAHSTYEVEVTYCDERQPKVIRVERVFEPDQKDILTHRGVATYEGEVYVCSIKTLRKIEE